MEKKDPYKINKINLNNIVYSKCKIKENKKVIYVKYQNIDKMSNFVFQLPSMLNIGEINNVNGIYEIDLPLCCKTNEQSLSLINFLNNLDKKIVRDAKLNSKHWFGNIGTSKYQNIIRKTKNNNKFLKDGLIRLKIIKTPDFETIIRINNKRDNIENANSPSWTKVLLEFYAIWINKNGFGGYFRQIIIDFKKISMNFYNYRLLEDSDCDDVPLTAIANTNNNNIFLKSKEKDQVLRESSIINFSSNEVNEICNYVSSDSSDSIK